MIDICDICVIINILNCLSKVNTCNYMHICMTVMIFTDNAHVIM